MDIFASFDDDLFSTQNERDIKRSTKYEAFAREDYWYKNIQKCDMSPVQLTILDNSMPKMKGDYYYMIKNFSMAIKSYIEAVNAEDTSLKMESTEALTRCYLQTSYFCKAQESCEMLQSMSKSTDALTSCYMLSFDCSFVCHDWLTCMLCAKSLIVMHKLNADVWLLLALSYSGQLGIKLKNLCSMLSVPIDINYKNCKNPTCFCTSSSSNEVDLKFLICALLHADYHLKSTYENCNRGLPKLTNNSFQEKISEILKSLDYDSSFTEAFKLKLKKTYHARHNTVFNDNAEVPRNDSVLLDIEKELETFEAKYLFLWTNCESE